MSKHMNFSFLPFFVLTINDLVASLPLVATFDSIIQCMNVNKNLSVNRLRSCAHARKHARTNTHTQVWALVCITCWVGRCFDNGVDLHLGGNILQSLLSEICCSCPQSLDERCYWAITTSVLYCGHPGYNLWLEIRLSWVLCDFSVSQSKEMLAILFHILSISSYAIVRPPFMFIKGT
jgi:hypothetical protein